MTAERRWALIFAWGGALLFAVSLITFLYSYTVPFGHPAAPAPGSSAARDAAIDIGLFSAFALHHSLLARSRAKALIARVIPLWMERSLYTWTASLLFMGVCLSWRPLPGVLYSVSAPWNAIGYAIQIFGVVLTARGSSAIGVLDLAGVRAVLDARRGRGPVHVPLVTNGLYGFVRHPLYFAWVLIVFGTPRMTATRFVFAAVSTAYLALAIPFEERALIRLFGDDYVRYRRQVKWRMLPGVY